MEDREVLDQVFGLRIDDEGQLLAFLSPEGKFEVNGRIVSPARFACFLVGMGRLLTDARARRELDIDVREARGGRVVVGRAWFPEWKLPDDLKTTVFGPR